MKTINKTKLNRILLNYMKDYCDVVYFLEYSKNMLFIISLCNHADAPAGYVEVVYPNNDIPNKKNEQDDYQLNDLIIEYDLRSKYVKTFNKKANIAMYINEAYKFIKGL